MIINILPDFSLRKKIKEIRALSKKTLSLNFTLRIIEILRLKLKINKKGRIVLMIGSD